MKWKLLLTLSVNAIVGCGLFAASGPTEVARGEYYSAGRPEYDGFFIVLHEKQVELLTAPSEPREARLQLTEAVSLTPEASDDALSERIGQEAKKLAIRGLRLRLDTPEPSRTLDASATLYTSDAATDTPLRSSLPQAATKLVRSRNRMLFTQAELEKLRVTGINLESKIDQAFRTNGPWKRDEVRRNLADGQKLITLMQSRAQEVENESRLLLTLVAAAATTDPSLGKVAAVDPAPALSEEAPKPRRTSSARSGNGSRPHGGSKPAPTAAPARAPNVRDDDASPARRPSQGSAPAEIEP